ncbi:MAG: hypothetical protein J6O04_01925 [Selenomonadaceae bacterium]|nr:hypothetical protein [Selenomonadaceae bacterium]
MEIEKKINNANNISQGLSEIIQGVIDFIGGLFNKTVNPVTLDEFVGKFSAKSDEIVLEEIQKGNKFLGGRFFVTLQDERHFQCSFEMFFETKDKEYIKLEGEKKNIQLRYIVENDILDLKQQKSIAFEIEEPKNLNNSCENNIKNSDYYSDEVKGQNNVEQTNDYKPKNEKIPNILKENNTENNEDKKVTISHKDGESLLEELLNNIEKDKK